MDRHFHHDADARPVLDLREVAAARAVHLADLPPLADDERAVAVRTWRARMVNEHVSSQVWASLVPQAMRAALPPGLIAELPRAASDELRHAEQCAAVVVALGGQPFAPLPDVEAVPEHDDVGPLEAFLRNAVSVGCLSETVAVAVIRAEHAELEGSLLGALLGAILADEVQHARLGWRLLGAIAPRLDDAARARMSAYLVDVLAHQIRHEVPRLPRLGAVAPALARAGVCDGGFARSVFFETVETVIVPQLERAGLDAGTAWARARAETTDFHA